MIKNYTKLLLAVFFLICFTGFSQTNLISNGDFENWTGNDPNNWTSTIDQVTRNQSDFNSGSSSVQIFNATTSQDATINSGSYNLEGGKTYLLRVDVKMTFINGSSTNDVPSIRYFAQRNTGGIGASGSHQTDTWETVQFEIDVPTDSFYTFEFSIALSSVKSSVQDILIDNVRLFDASEIPENIVDRNALIALYNSTDGASWQRPWDLNKSMYSWDGITTNDAGRVTKIKLRANNLIGFLPPEIGDLEELLTLDLTKNGFQGQLENSISGIIPSELGNLIQLKEIYLNNFEISGNIPPEIGQMSGLERLFLNNNNLTGIIPLELGNLSNLKNLNLNYNGLNGNIPSTLGQLDQLEVLNLKYNDLSGSIPSTLGQMTNLSYLDLGNNGLTGGIPEQLGQLHNLETLDLGQNNLGGTIPTQLGQLVSLKNLVIDRNSLTGTLPEELSTLSSLERLSAELNSLEGEIPTEYSALTSLKFLDLNFNRISGSIPPSLGQLPNLIGLYLSRNNLIGDIPVELTQIPTLNNLFLDRNNLNGTVPIFPNSISDFRLNTNSFVFEDLKSNATNHVNFYYTPQENIGEPETIIRSEGQEFTVSVNNTTDVDNEYQWRKDGVEIDGATNSSFIIPNVTAPDAGVYDCLITNTVLPSLTLTKNPITLQFTVGDDDNDGVNNANDNCPNTPTGENVDVNGCSQNQLDDDNDGVINSNDQCPNTPSGNTVDSQGCIVSNNNQVNYAQNFSFENWSTNPATPEDWTIENENSIIQSTDATDGSSSLELDLNNSLQFKTELINTTAIQLATNTTYTYAFDYKIKRGTNVSAEIHISKDGNPYGIPLLREYTTFNTDGNWHTFSFDFDTNDTDESHIFRLIFRANTTETGIIILDNLRVLGDPLPDADNDGVLDNNDLCPNTSDTALAVDDDGCEVTIDGSNLLEDPSFEDWSYGGGTNLSKWGIYIQLGSWVKNTDISDNLQYSVELITGGASSNSIFQNELQFYKGVEYIISIDYQVLEGTFTTLQLELTEGGIFGDIVAEFSTTPSSSGWQTFSTTFTPTSNEMLDLGIRVESGQTGDRILLDNTIIRANVTAVGDDDNDGIINTNDNCPNTPAGDTVDENGCTVTTITDSDNDGVADADDDCPNTPTGDTVDENGCTITTITDSDNDGVADADDDCPNTPTGDTVDENGCTITT
ncbi:leucine-rich repeat domain-containing protein, partial [uncultured Maribacter sp.]|uniref:leucine-rich repeat domain-containing protein n=1 Tax=uncultured Maribacter sp. TaxID=431308 RepID=UPI00263004C3